MVIIYALRSGDDHERMISTGYITTSHSAEVSSLRPGNLFLWVKFQERCYIDVCGTLCLRARDTEIVECEDVTNSSSLLISTSEDGRKIKSQ